MEDIRENGFNMLNLEEENIFKMSLSEIENTISDLHQALFKSSNVHFGSKNVEYRSEEETSDYDFDLRRYKIINNYCLFINFIFI